MKAERDVKKGKVISVFKPLLLLPSDPFLPLHQRCSEKAVLLETYFCEVCGKTILPLNDEDDKSDLRSAIGINGEIAISKFSNLPRFLENERDELKECTSYKSCSYCKDLLSAQENDHRGKYCYCSFKCKSLAETQDDYRSRSIPHHFSCPSILSKNKFQKETEDNTSASALLLLQQFLQRVFTVTTSSNKSPSASAGVNDYALLSAALMFRSIVLMKSNSSDSDTQKETSTSAVLRSFNDIVDFVKFCYDDSQSHNEKVKGSPQTIHNFHEDMNIYDDEDHAVQCWAYLRTAFQRRRNSSTTCSESTSRSTTNQIAKLQSTINGSPRFFTFLQHYIRCNCLYHLPSIPHPLCNYIREKLLTILTDEELITVLKSLPAQLLKYALRGDKDSTNLRTYRLEEISDKMKPKTDFSVDSNDLEGELFEDWNIILKNKVVRWRLASRLVQLTSDNSGDLEDVLCENDAGNEGATNINCTNNISRYEKNSQSMGNPSLFSTFKRDYYAFLPQLSEIRHSCIPNCIVEGTTTLIAGSEDAATSLGSLGLGPVNASLVALHDICANRDLTVSKISNLSGDIDERASALKELFGRSFTCLCVRCRCEQNWDRRRDFVIIKDASFQSYEEGTVIKAPMQFYWKDLKHMGDLAMQQGRFQDASDLYGLVLQVCPNDGDVLHARCASYLERGSFLTAHKMWKESKDICPHHDGINLQVQKQDIYGPLYESKGVLDQTISSSSILKPVLDDAMFITLIPEKCFVTKPECPIISPEECQSAILWAEEASSKRKGGWTTSRHYAVPTTDLPVHEVPHLLPWFNNLLKKKLRPILALLYGEREVGKDGCNVYINDAFIVRYDADGGQQHLPLHRDQSTHSFTIALNDLSDYVGGGTYVTSLGYSIRPSLGGIMCFRGDQLLHGGDFVVKGVRYIIVAFCYVCKDISLEEKIIHRRKRLKVNSTFQAASKKGKYKSDFSFGFQF